ncbi:MAG: hypothetical protein K2O40_04680 [Lachnospiraceae bacterium]|nr:hypothetical protein [Lachnospiraceae bacterium]
MKRLLKTEYFKLLKSFSFWLLIALSIEEGILYGIAPVLYASSVTGYDMYVLRLSQMRLNLVLIGVFAASFLCSEFVNHTFVLSFLCGFSRWQIYLAKVIVFFTGVLPIILSHVITATIVVTADKGFGIPFDYMLLVEMISRMVRYLSDVFAMGSYLFFTAFFIRNPVGTFGIGVCLSYLYLVLSTGFQVVSLWIYLAVSISGISVLLFVTAFYFEKCDLF